MNENIELKIVFNYFCSSFENFLAKFDVRGVGKKLMCLDLSQFMMYLSAADGAITWNEAKMINDMLEVDTPPNPNEIVECIKVRNINSAEFVRTVPESFQVAVRADQIYRAQGLEGLMSEAMLGMFKMFGEAIIKCDGNVDDSKITAYNIYIKMLEDYRDNILNGGSAVSESNENSEAVPAPEKRGVPAPRKG